MTAEQRDTVVQVYKHLLNNESRGWDGLDDYIDFLEYLDNDQLYREADALYSSKHKDKKVKCKEIHDPSECFIPLLVNAARYIIEWYKEQGSLHNINKYILQYYLAINQSDMILISEV